MISRLWHVAGSVALTGIISMGMVTGANAQDESTNRVAANTDWSVFVEDSPRECWGVSQPKEERIVDGNGNPTTGRRGEVLLFVMYQPDGGVNGQVAFTGGYPFAGTSVTMTIGDTEYELFVGENSDATPINEQEWAWPATPEDDAQIVAAMKRGANAVLRGRSPRGNQTIDTFSLLGFTAAVDEAARRCERGSG